MKVLIAGETQPWSAETSYAKELRKQGCDVTVWDNKSPSLLFGNRSWWALTPPERMAYDALASLRFYRLAKSYRPDVLFLPKAENIHSYAIKRILEECRARLVIWYPDHPFKADMTTMNVLRNLRRCDRFYIWGKFLVEAIQAAGCPRVEYLPFAFDPEMHRLDLEVLNSDRARYASDISFIGAWDREREEDLKPLSEFNLAIWGPGWSTNLSKKSPLQEKVKGGGIYKDDLVSAYRSSNVVFNHLRRHNGSAHNVRTMEVGGIAGGIQLVRRTHEQAMELFEEDKHLLCFGSNEEMVEKVHWALNHKEETVTMAKQMQNHVFERHLLKFRIKQILDDLQK